MIVTLELLPFGNPGYVVGLPLITIKSVFFFYLEKYNKLSGKNDILSGKCQGILNRLKCGNPGQLTTLSTNQIKPNQGTKFPYLSFKFQVRTVFPM